MRLTYTRAMIRISNCGGLSQMLHDMRIEKNSWATTSDFQQCSILTSVDSDESLQNPVKLRHSKCCSVSSLTVMNIQATSKGSDQTEHVRRLAWAFAGRTYHIVGNIVSRLSFINKQSRLHRVSVLATIFLIVWIIVMPFTKEMDMPKFRCFGAACIGLDDHTFWTWNFKYVLNHQCKHLFWVLKRTVSLIRFFCVPTA